MIHSHGSPLHLGAELLNGGVNFAIFSKNAHSVSLLLFKNAEDKFPETEIPFDPAANKTGNTWHIFVENLRQGDFYAYRIDGPHNVNGGHRFKKKNVLLDPYAKAITDIGGVPKGVIVPDDFDWQGISKPGIPWCDTIIYETHLRGLTVDRTSRCNDPGTYKGAIEKIPYLKELGITTVEFLPVHEFNHLEKPHKNPVTGERMGNYWGYSTVGFFAPKGSYSSSGNAGGQVDEFRRMVREFHRAGIEVILDVVYNHTAEMNYRGPVYNFRGIDNKSYYILQRDKRRYINLSGCGNSFYCNGSAGRRLILDSLRYWYVIMGVDGFRFDLATMFYRDEKGDWCDNSPIIRDIRDDNILSDAKLISEPWDAGGGYNPGAFGDASWCDWNDKFRDDTRKFWSRKRGATGNFASRLAGSQDMFYKKSSPLNSINFITAHDGFTLNDVVSYKKKHNHENGHSSKDGASENWSMNFGHEGETGDPKIAVKRLRQAKNFILTLFLSQGVPMLLGGDEFLRTQKGNNNAYRLDNEISWYNWNFMNKNAEFHRFVKEVIKFRKAHPVLRRDEFFAGKAESKNRYPDISWYNENCSAPAWNGNSNRLSCRLNGRSDDYHDDDLLLLFNAEPRKRVFMIPPSCNGNSWSLMVDTAAESPFDIIESSDSRALDDQKQIMLKSGSAVVLKADRI